MLQSAAQMMGTSISNFDRDSILLQIYPQVTTRKLLLVGHSQGAFYSNALYDYLLSHGEPKAAVGVYQVATPAAAVAGNGKYLNSSGDTMLGTLRELGFTFLANNISLVSSADDAQSAFPGHSFSGAYLAGAPERIVGDMQGALSTLKAELATDTGECFTAPDSGLAYQVLKAGYTVADTTALGIKAGVVAAGDTLTYAALGAYNLATKVATDFGITVGGIAGITSADTADGLPITFDLIKKLYGSSITKDEYEEFLSDLGSSVATAPIFAAAPTQGVTEEKKIIYLSGGANKEDADTAPQDQAPQEEPAPEIPVEPDVPEMTEEIDPPIIEPPVVEELPVHIPSLVTIASQEDESQLCDDPEWGGWLNCYVDTETGIFTTDLGSGLSGAVDSLTISKDRNSPYNVFHPYLITIECFVDGNYATPCLKWVTPGVATGNRDDALVQKASETSDGRYMTAYFRYIEGRNTGILYPKDASGNVPVYFDPAHYYRLSINDLGWSTGVYGSATEPYWVLKVLK